MRVVAQNVLNASVKVNEQTIGQIERGLLLFVGFKDGDTKDIVERVANKIVTERVFEDENGLTNLSLQDIKGDILSVSQFTLYADLKKGHRPSFTTALKPDEAEKLYDYFNDYLANLTKREIHKGKFGADMIVNIVNDGPFTTIYDSEELFKK